MISMTHMPRLRSRCARGIAALTVLTAAFSGTALAISGGPASAAGQVLLVGTFGNHQFTCAAAQHGLDITRAPWQVVNNGCANRFWVSTLNGNSYCFTGNKTTWFTGSKAGAILANHALVSANKAPC